MSLAKGGYVLYLVSLFAKELFKARQGNSIRGHEGGDGEVGVRGSHLLRDLLVDRVLDDAGKVLLGKRHDGGLLLRLEGVRFTTG